MNNGVLSKVANAIAQRHPDVVSALDHTMYGNRLDQLEAETDAAHAKLEEQWASPDPGSSA